MKLGIMGGTFDPIHLGHLLIAENARHALGLDRVLFVPAGRPWLRGNAKVSEAHHRLRMVELAIAGNPAFSATGVEIDRPGPTYTVDTLETLKREYGEDTDLFFIIGSDALVNMDRWRSPARLFELCTLAVFGRNDGEDTLALSYRLTHQFPQIVDAVVWMGRSLTNISSTDIRRRLASAAPVRYMVPDSVEQYIREHGLYTAD